MQTAIDSFQKKVFLALLYLSGFGGYISDLAHQTSHTLMFAAFDALMVLLGLMSFSKLRRHVHELARKGIDTTESMVDLHLKLAIPCVTLAMVLIGVPLAMRNQRQRSLAANAGLGLTIGFSYWVLLALAVSLGHGGAIPPIVAAWTANIIFAVLGAFLFLGAE